MSDSYAIELKNVTKRFGSVIANDQVNLTVKKGEILSILGENGSGKTTLMNMLSGIYLPDEGQIFMDGKEVAIRSPKDAFDLKIGMIHQHFKLIDVLTAAQNIILGLSGKQFLDMKQVEKDVEELVTKYGFELNPGQKIYNMSVSEKQTVEIIKVLYRGADLLILDEPTAVLTPQETDKLFAVLQNMRNAGKSIIIITHKLQEVLAISDRVSVLRKGKYIGTVETKDATVESLTEMMVGAKVSLDIVRSESEITVNRLAVSHLTCLNHEGRKIVNDVSFTAKSGEILGVAGIAGSGMKELLEAIAGLQKAHQGEIVYWNPEAEIQTAAAEHANGTNEEQIENEPESIAGYTGSPVKISGLRPEEIRDMGVCLSFVPEDRLGMGLVGSMDLAENMMIRSYRSGKSPFVDSKRPKKLAKKIVKKLDVVTPGISTPVGRLSGGNVQKVLVGREIAANPNVLMVAYPVRGLDINSSYMIYNLLNQQKEKGVAVICVIEDLDVLLELSDRIMVMNNGHVTGICDARKTTKEEIGVLMTKNTEEGR